MWDRSLSLIPKSAALSMLVARVFLLVDSFILLFWLLIKFEQLLRHAQVVGVWIDIGGSVGVFYADVVVHVVIVELMTDAIFRS